MTTVDATVAAGEQWDASKFVSKQHLLQVLRGSAAQFFDLVAVPGRWEVQISPEWQVRDPASFVLTSFGRIRAGTAYGDRELADRFRGMFFAI